MYACTVVKEYHSIRFGVAGAVPLATAIVSTPNLAYNHIDAYICPIWTTWLERHVRKLRALYMLQSKEMWMFRNDTVSENRANVTFGQWCLFFSTFTYKYMFPVLNVYSIYNKKLYTIIRAQVWDWLSKKKLKYACKCLYWCITKMGELMHPEQHKA